MLVNAESSNGDLEEGAGDGVPPRDGGRSRAPRDTEDRTDATDSVRSVSWGVLARGVREPTDTSDATERREDIGVR